MTDLLDNGNLLDYKSAALIVSDSITGSAYDEAAVIRVNPPMKSTVAVDAEND